MQATALKSGRIMARPWRRRKREMAAETFNNVKKIATLSHPCASLRSCGDAGELLHHDMIGFGVRTSWSRSRGSHRLRYYPAIPSLPLGAAWLRSLSACCQRRRKNVPARRRKSVPRARWQLVPVVHGRDPRAGRRALGAAGGGPRVGEWNGRLPPLMPVVGRVEVDPHGPTASKCQGGRFGVFPGKPEGPR